MTNETAASDAALPSLSAALVVWTGWGEEPRPVRDERRLVERFGEAVAVVLLPRIRELEGEFYASEAWNVVGDLKEVGDRAAVEFRARHAELSDEAVAALAWCYTYDFK